MDPVSAHVAHIRHLARPSALEPFLRARHGFSPSFSKKLAVQVAPFLEQAIIFHDASQLVPLRARSLLQYYSYLNLAVALVLIYQPTGWQEYRKHGVEDITRTLQRVSLSSPVIRVRHGALTLFHSIISEGRLPAGNISLRDLFVPIPMVASELEHAFGIRTLSLSVVGEVHLTGEGQSQIARSYFTFRLLDRGNRPSEDPGNAKFPLKRLYRIMPTLKSQYRAQQRKGHTRTFESIQKWTTTNKERADRFHDEVAIRFLNFGGQQVDMSGNVDYFWLVEPNSELLPTLTSGLLLSFVLASLSRYRANILDRAESSKINLLFEVFTSESDGFMIPAMRNLLYAEAMYVGATDFT